MRRGSDPPNTHFRKFASQEILDDFMKQTRKFLKLGICRKRFQWEFCNQMCPKAKVTPSDVPSKLDLQFYIIFYFLVASMMKIDRKKGFSHVRTSIYWNPHVRAFQIFYPIDEPLPFFVTILPLDLANLRNPNSQDPFWLFREFMEWKNRAKIQPSPWEEGLQFE